MAANFGNVRSSKESPNPLPVDEFHSSSHENRRLLVRGERNETKRSSFSKSQELLLTLMYAKGAPLTTTMGYFYHPRVSPPVSGIPLLKCEDPFMVPNSGIILMESAQPTSHSAYPFVW
ncbi:hypothetical protein CEXT_352551 [Caerostris extrusa]|uniref:Uncharacterized protein n=1 Tax=Caerostris extrusa TaxID=172846 RepID=A0AAV4NUX4_CAEEX|nr:hypothetical protein CEXT_352551 [Caerostris extrusa]